MVANDDQPVIGRHRERSLRPESGDARRRPSVPHIKGSIDGGENYVQPADQRKDLDDQHGPRYGLGTRKLTERWQRKLKTKLGCILAASALLASFMTTAAAASTTYVSEADGVEIDEVVDLQGAVLDLEDSGVVIIGGETQSTDPTAYNYLPPTPSEPTIGVMSANGYQLITGFSLTVAGVPVGVPSGFLNHEIFGSGLSINAETATFGPIRNVQSPWSVALCDVRIDFQNRTSAGALIKTYAGTTKSGCFKDLFPSRTDSVVRTLGAGQQCARLYVGGAYRGEQCHAIRA